jgi:hypothetical protein
MRRKNREKSASLPQKPINLGRFNERGIPRKVISGKLIVLICVEVNIELKKGENG